MTNFIERRNAAEFALVMAGIEPGTMQAARVAMAWHAALGAAARVADEMADELIAEETSERFTVLSVVNGYRMIAKQIRQKQEACKPTRSRSVETG